MCVYIYICWLKCDGDFNKAQGHGCCQRFSRVKKNEAETVLMAGGIVEINYRKIVVSVLNIFFILFMEW